MSRSSSVVSAGPALGGGRQGEAEARTATLAVFGPDPTLVLFDDATGNGQPESDVAAGSLALYAHQVRAGLERHADDDLTSGYGSAT